MAQKEFGSPTNMQIWTDQRQRTLSWISNYVEGRWPRSSWSRHGKGISCKTGDEREVKLFAHRSAQHETSSMTILGGSRQTRSWTRTLKVIYVWVT